MGFSQISGITKYTTNNGLSSNTVYDIVQDENGFILLATDYGLSKFDGKKFVNYTIDDGLPDNEILYFYKDSYNKIWLIGFNGKVGYYQDGCFYNSRNNDICKQLVFSEFICDMFEDSQGNIWFAEFDEGIKKLSSDGIVREVYSEEIFHNKVGNKMYFIENKNDDVLLATARRDSVVSLNISKNHHYWKSEKFKNIKEYSFKKLQDKKAALLTDFDQNSQKVFQTIQEDIDKRQKGFHLFKLRETNSKYWITNIMEGVAIIDKATFQKVKYLEEDQTTKSYQDNEGNIWIGTKANGVLLVTNPESSLIRFKDIAKQNLHSIATFHKFLALGTESGIIQILDTTNFKIVKEVDLDDLKIKNKVQQIKKYKNDIYFICEHSIYKADTLFKNRKIEKILDVTKGYSKLSNIKDASFLNDVCYTSHTYGVGAFHLKSKKMEIFKKGRSTSIYAHNKDSIWIGGTSYFSLFNDKGELINKRKTSNITNIQKYNDSTIIIGTNSCGFALLTKEKIKYIDKDKGLVNNFIKSIYVDENKNIWVSTNNGINKVNLDSNLNLSSVKHFTVSEGLNCNNVRKTYISKDKLYVATGEGFSVLNIDTPEQNKFPPKIHLNKVLVNNYETDFETEQIYNFDQNDFEFDFSGISFYSLGNITYKYRLLGLENEWRETSSSKIRYPALSPGKYTFEVYAISKSELPSTKIVQLAFKIKKPFYLSYPFIIAVGSIILFVALYFYNHNRKKILIRNKLNSLKFQALNAQMNPHFINNLLSCIQELIEDGNKREAIHYLQKFSDLTNLILQSTKSNLITLSRELKIVQLYLDLKLIRHNHAFSYKINTEELIKHDLFDITVPPLILQPLIENSIIHGMQSNPENGKIDISFEAQKNNFLICKIKDNGIGMNFFNKRKGISLQNINERLKIINDCPKNENLINITNIYDKNQKLKGTQVTLRIPYLTI